VTRTIFLLFEDREISASVNPIVAFPWNPVALLEGDIDVAAQIDSAIQPASLQLPLPGLRP
jgi:hypothetical protein